MEEWKRLEFSYAKRLRECSASERRSLYSEAYSRVAAASEFESTVPEQRTAGTGPEIVELIAHLLRPSDDVLEVGCGRGYTCMMLAPRVRSVVGTDVSDAMLVEAASLMRSCHRTNATIRKVSALDLADCFSTGTFDACVSIDVMEHLHPEDASEHLRQACKVLRPGGRYIVVSPSRLTGPHDVTRVEFPALREALGFHLNESTYAELTAMMRTVGFTTFRAFYPLRVAKRPFPLVAPWQVSLIGERLYERRIGGEFLANRVFRKFVSIRLIAQKP